MGINKLEIDAIDPTLDYPEIRSDNVETFEDFYMSQDLELELQEETNPDRKMVLAARKAIVDVELERRLLRGKEVKNEKGLDLSHVFMNNRIWIEQKIRSGEIESHLPNEPRRQAEHFAVTGLRDLIKDYYNVSSTSVIEKFKS